MDDDYKNFVERMGSFEDVIDLDGGNIDDSLQKPNLMHSGKNFIDSVLYAVETE